MQLGQPCLRTRAYYRKINNLEGARYNSNLLPTGCYAYRRASHGYDKQTQRFKVPTALRLTAPSSGSDGPATVLRTSNDLAYGLTDLWDRSAAPCDNIHPAFATDGSFSSAGCLTVRGTIVRFTDNASAEWKKFLDHIDDIPKEGRIDLVLLTGAEAAIAGGLRAQGLAGDPATVTEQLVRLRHGSKGVLVEKLQAAVGVGVDGDFGPGTKTRLTELQGERLDGRADGVYSPAAEAKLRLGVLPVAGV